MDEVMRQLTKAGVHSIHLRKFRGGAYAHERASGATSWTAEGHGYLQNRVSVANRMYFGYGSGATYGKALADLLRVVRERNRRGR